ncbi:MAG: hypothetical protein AAF194_00450, partial [Pseudomonadota bacterium]
VEGGELDQRLCSLSNLIENNIFEIQDEIQENAYSFPTFSLKSAAKKHRVLPGGRPGTSMQGLAVTSGNTRGQNKNRVQTTQ